MSVRYSIDDHFKNQDELFSSYDDFVNAPAGNRFHIVWESHLFYLEDWNACGLLSYLLGIQNIRMHHENKTDREQMRRDRCWFRRTAKTMQYRVRMKKDKLKTAIDKLVDAGVIEVEYRQFHHTWVRINLLKLREIETKEPPKDDPFLDGDEVQRTGNPPVESNPTSGNPSRSTSGNSSLLPNRINTNINLDNKEPANAGNSLRKPVKNDKFAGKTKNKVNDSQLHEWVDRLHSYKNKVNKTHDRLNPTWKPVFRSAFNKSNYTREQVEIALQTIEAAASDPLTEPKPQSPTHFINSMKFILRSAEDTETTGSSSSPPSKETISEIITLLSNIRWQDQKALEHAVRKSAAAYEDFVAKFIKLKTRLKNGEIKTMDANKLSSLKSFVDYAADEIRHGTVVVIHAWFAELDDRTWNWSEWDGDLRREVWKLSHKIMKKKLFRWSQESTGNSSGIDTFMEVL